MKKIAVKFPTSEADKVRINKMFDDVLESMGYLYSRWQDEKQYEDFEEYKKVMIKNLEPFEGFTLTKATKRPFGFQFTIGNGALYAVEVNSRSSSWGRIG